MSADEPTWWQADGEPAELEAEAADGATTPGPLGRRRKVLTIAAVAGGVALTGGVALAAAHGGTKTAQQGPGGGQGGGPGGGQGFGGPGGGQGFGGPPGSTGGTTGEGGQGGGPGGGPPGLGSSSGQQQVTPPQTESGSGTGSTGSQQGGPGGGTGFGGRGGFGGPGRGLGMAIHGEYVVESSSGNYTTMLTQRGTVTAVSSSSLSVKSVDGYDKTYVVPSSVSVSSIKSGDTIGVTATVKDRTATVTEVHSGNQDGAPPQGGSPPSPDGSQPSTTT